jgi:fatty-acyl-CoA synthase
MPDFNLALVHEAIGAAIPDREALVFRDRRITFGQLRERTRRLAHHLIAQGMRTRRERSDLAPWESGQDHLALYLYNGNEYIEGMLGAFKARVAPINVNYRYVDDELIYLLRDARARAILYHGEFAPTLGRIRDELPDLETLIQVADGSGHALLAGAVDYEAALADASPEVPPVEWSPDDLYILYTGGTTGMPKGVLWRQGDIFPVSMGGRNLDQSEKGSLEAIVADAQAGGGLRMLICPPLMHGAAQWSTFGTLANGNTIVLSSDPRRFDPDDALSTVERERASLMVIVGDAFARPLLDRLQEKRYDLSSLRIVASGGAPLSKAHKEEILGRIPGSMVLDAIGSSETGGQGTDYSTQSSRIETGKFKPVPDTGVLSAKLDRVLQPEEGELGWFAQAGRVPLGYLGDAEKTAKTFPVIEGRRWSIPGDRARYGPNGVIQVLGRDSVTIVSGGEKVFAEEVENALKLHPAVFDAIVCGRPSGRWGEEVVALVRLRKDRAATEEELLAECRKYLARYKLPKAFFFEPEIVRSPSGKPDYRWARARVTGGISNSQRSAL